jgi:hypothetical protein
LAIFRQLGWIDAPHTQNFEILKSLEPTQEPRKFKISFDFFVKMPDGLNFGKRCILRCSIRNFFQNRKILEFSNENSEIYFKHGQKLSKFVHLKI